MPLDALAFGNDAIADVLDEIADLIELKGENVFRAVTYRAAARAIPPPRGRPPDRVAP